MWRAVLAFSCTKGYTVVDYVVIIATVIFSAPLDPKGVRLFCVFVLLVGVNTDQFLKSYRMRKFPTYWSMCCIGDTNRTTEPARHSTGWTLRASFLCTCQQQPRDTIKCTKLRRNKRNLRATTGRRGEKSLYVVLRPRTLNVEMREIVNPQMQYIYVNGWLVGVYVHFTGRSSRLYDVILQALRGQGLTTKYCEKWPMLVRHGWMLPSPSGAYSRQFVLSTSLKITEKTCNLQAFS